MALRRGAGLVQRAGRIPEAGETIFGNDLPSAVLWFGRLQWGVAEAGPESRRRLEDALYELFPGQEAGSGQAEGFGLFRYTRKDLFEGLGRQGCAGGQGEQEQEAGAHSPIVTWRWQRQLRRSAIVGRIIQFARVSGGFMSVEQKVKQIIVEQLGVDEAQVDNTASFVDDLGADSLDLVELIMAFEEAFDLDIPDEEA